MPDLILLYGVVSSGKTTLAKRYSQETPLSLCLEGDQLISMLSHWTENEIRAQQLVFGYSRAVVAYHLGQGENVIVPYVLLRPDEAQAFEDIAREQSANFIEVLINTSKQTSVERTLARGTWGEPDAPPVSLDDQPVIEDLYDRQVQTLRHRPNLKLVESIDGEPELTCQSFLKVVKG